MKALLVVLAVGLLIFFGGRHGCWRMSGDAVSTVAAEGEGRVVIPADMAEVTVSTGAVDKTASAVNDVLAARTAAILAFLKENGKARALRTDQVSITPRYDTTKNPAVQNGVDGTVAVHFTCATSDAGELIAGALRNGATGSDFNSRIADDALNPAREQAIAAAVADALWKARAALKAAGLVETKIRNVTVSTPGQPPVSLFARAAKTDNAIPIEAGRREVIAAASVVLEFRKK